MCGILGVFGDLKAGEEKCNEMLSLIKHRGPDDIGVVKNNLFYLGHQRLSIVDLDGGAQPIQDTNDDLHLVCNGEIYNNEVLKKERCAHYDFNTNSDSEVIIPLYKQDGMGAVKALDGMFTFILSENDNYFVARDPVGIKPLYWGSDGKSLFFSSEIKAMANFTETIKEFPNGCYYNPDDGLIRYYKFPSVNKFINDIDVAVSLIRSKLEASVEKRLMSDVPVGVFLSGGLDSSIIAALMKEKITELHSFSVGLADCPDIKAAKQVSEHLGTIHHEYIYTEEEMQDVISDVIYYLESYDPALVRSAIPCYFVSRLASDYVKVVLSGEGADELFAGYSYFSDFNDAKKLHSESLRIIKGLHNLNLQRVDRMTMAHGIEGRVPFLDIDFIETVLRISPELKLHSAFGMEKWILRKAFEDKLPSDVVWRDKMEFALGCGSSKVFEQKTQKTQKLFNSTKKNEEAELLAEELYYLNLFREHFDHPEADKLIGRWNGMLH